MDSRNRHAPREAGFYIPSTTERTAERGVTNGARSCKVAIQTNTVDADERGFVYLADRANTGRHIGRLTRVSRSIDSPTARCNSGGRVGDRRSAPAGGRATADLAVDAPARTANAPRASARGAPRDSGRQSASGMIA